MLSFFREDDARKDEAKPDLDALSSDLSDILGVSMKPARVGRRRAALEEEAKLEKERQERQDSEERRRRTVHAGAARLSTTGHSAAVATATTTLGYCIWRGVAQLQRMWL